MIVRAVERPQLARLVSAMMGALWQHGLLSKPEISQDALGRQTDRQTDRQPDRQTDRRTDGRTDGTDRWTDRDGWTDSETDTQTDRPIFAQ